MPSACYCGFQIAWFWLALQLYPLKTGFMTVLSICSFSFVVLIPQTLLRVPLVMAKNTNQVYLGAAAFLPQEWIGSPLFNLLDKIDIFSIWGVALLILGVRYTVGLTKGQAVMTVGYLWVLWLLLAMFFGNLVQVV